MIRFATKEDLPRIVELGSRSLQDGPYKGIIKDNPQQAAVLAIETINSLNGKILLYVNDAGIIAGLLAFMTYKHYFTAEMTAAELMWYVVPESRADGNNAGMNLLWAAQREAKSMGAIGMQFTAPTREAERIYERIGYKAIETMFYKAL